MDKLHNAQEIVKGNCFCIVTFDFSEVDILIDKQNYCGNM